MTLLLLASRRFFAMWPKGMAEISDLPAIDASRLGGLAYLPLGGEMVARVKAHDWSATPLGDPVTWRPELIAAASFVLESRFPAALIWGEHLTTIYNDAFRPILGDKPEALGRSFADIWAEAWDTIGPIAAKAFAGEATFIEDFPLEIDRTGRPEIAYFTFCYSPVRAADGTICGMIDTVIETTATVQARTRGTILNRELGHRLKNTMAMVQAIAAQSLKKVEERDLVDGFLDRIVALGRAHDVLLEESWEAAPITSVIAQMLGLHGGDGRFRTGGPDLVVGPKAVLSLSLLFHELATNAAKYGSLSVLDGQVSLTWRLDGAGSDATLVMAWQESGGPPPHEPSRTGFGSRLIDMGLVGTGAVVKHYYPSGFEAKFRAPLKQLTLS